MTDAYPGFDADLASFNESINSVDESVHEFLWKRHRARTLVIHSVTIGFAIVFAALEIFSFDWQNVTRDTATGAVMFPILPLIPLAIYYMTVSAKMSALFHTQLAEAIGFTYSGRADMSTVDGRIFEFGDSRVLSEVYTGMFGAYPGRFYTYTYYVQHGKSSDAYAFTVGEIDYGRELPHLLLRPKKNRLAREWAFSGSELLTLEGGFSDAYDYYAQAGHQIEALQVMEPTVMALFADSYPDFGFETYGTKLYVFCPFYGIRTKQGFMGLHELLLTLGTKLVPELRNVSVGTAATG